MTNLQKAKRVLRRMVFHLSKKKRAKLSAELTRELAGSFKHEPHPVFMDQPN